MNYVSTDTAGSRFPPRSVNHSPLLESFATKQANDASRRRAAIVCVTLLAASLATLPFAAEPVAAVPGFFALNQGALLIVHGLTAWLFFAQYCHTQYVPLLLLGSGEVFTTLVLAVQLVCLPNMLAPGLLLGSGVATMSWLWVLWHIGPPLFVLAYAVLEGGRPRYTQRPRLRRMLAGTLGGVCIGGLGLALVPVYGADRLPTVVDADGGFRALTSSGIGPALLLLTVTALAVLIRVTRLRGVLQLWLGVSVFLLLLDNVVTSEAGARATLGWMAGRFEAVLAGIVILAAYSRELGVLYRHAEATALEREAARAVAQAARTNLEIALDASEMGEWELDLLTGRSRRTLRHDRIFGYMTAQPAWGWTQFLEHVVPEDRPTISAAIEAAMRGERLAHEFRIRRRDDTVRWVALWGRATFDASGRASAISGCLMDTTRRRETEARLRQVARMEAVGQLTGGMAHDFNNLLTVILGSLDLILRHKEDAPRVERLAHNAFAAGRRGIELTDRLRSFSALQEPGADTIDLNQVLHDALPLLRRCAGETVLVKPELDATVGPARTDPQQFQAVMLKLVAMAREAMPEGGALRIATRNTSLPGGADDAVPPGEYLQVQVQGPRSAMAVPGDGAPLHALHELIRQAGGHCAVGDADGGFSVSLYFSRPRGASQSEPAGSQPVLRRAQGGEVVLVVEDDEMVRDMAGESLTALGYGVMTASDARIALDLLRYPTRIDILFSDVVMPGGMTGAQLVEEARKLRPSLKVLLTSGYPAFPAGGCELPPGVPLLPKPYLREDLAARLQSVLTS